MIERHHFLYPRTQGVCVNDVTVYSGGKDGKDIIPPKIDNRSNNPGIFDTYRPD
jgi:hypothetical protein